MHAPARIAATVVVALAAASVAAGCSASNGPLAPAPSRAAATGASPSVSAAGGKGSPPASVPRYYVALDPAQPDGLFVRETATGAVVGSLPAPQDTVFTAVFGTGTGRVFVVEARPVRPTPGGGDELYLVHLAPGSESSPKWWIASWIEPLHAGHAAGPGLTALALSPDASKIAIAYTYRTYPPNPQPVILYRVATGAVLRTWTVASGIISAADPMGNGDLGQDPRGTSMRWTADGRGLAFAFHANAAPGKQGYGYDRAASIRLLDTTAPGRDLIANSRGLNGPGPEYNPGNGAGTQCLAGNGWSLSADGQAVTCAAEWGTPGPRLPKGTRPAECARSAAGSATRQLAGFGFWRQFTLPDGSGGAETIYGVCPAATAAGIHLFWASPDGTMVLGALDYPGHSMFGLFSKGAFRKLPPPPPGTPLTSIAW
jgi:hypothetical protein